MIILAMKVTDLNKVQTCIASPITTSVNKVKIHGKHKYTPHIEFYSIPIHAKFLLIINSIDVV